MRNIQFTVYFLPDLVKVSEMHGLYRGSGDTLVNIELGEK
jgi:hypothetical protein